MFIRTMSEFKKEGIIRVFGKTIEVVDLVKLEIHLQARMTIAEFYSLIIL